MVAKAIHVNGQIRLVKGTTISYEQLCKLAKQGLGATAVCEFPDGHGVSIIPGETVELIDGTIFSVVHTGNA